MLPLDQSSSEAFAKSTGKVRRALLRMVDAYPRDLPPPTAGSTAVRDIAAEVQLRQSHRGWGEVATNLRWLGGIQVFAAAEACAALALLLGEDRVFLNHPYFSARFAGESSGKAQWLFDLTVDSIGRFVRVQNLQIEDLYRRRRLIEGDARAAATSRCGEMRSAARAHGLELTARNRAISGRYIVEAPPSSTEFAIRGFDDGYGSKLTALASSAVHGSTTAMLNHLFDFDHSQPTGLRAKLGMRSDTAILLMLAAGAAFKDAVDAQLAYHGLAFDRWTEKSFRFMALGTKYVQAGSVGAST